MTTPMANQTQDVSTFTDDLARVIQSSRAARAVRACLLTTRDRDQALSHLKDVASNCARPLFHFTASGRRRYNPTQLRWDVVGQGTTDGFGLLQYAQELRTGGVVVFEDFTSYLRDDGGDRRVRMALMQMLSCETITEGLVLVFLAPPEAENHLPSILADQFVRLEVCYPRAEELQGIAREEVAALLQSPVDASALDLLRKEADRLATGLVGLTRSAARDALRDALAPNPQDYAGASERLQARKGSQLRRELAMNVLDTEKAEEPIGLDYLVEYLAITREKIRICGPSRARGILLIGPPGTGKTMLARSIGRLVDLPVVEFRISSLMNSLLGETERRFSQAFATLEAMSPNVVFIDEIEKAFGDSSERDGGTMMRCTGSLLSWLSDNPYPNYIVATSNSLRRMGEIGLTMTRSERFDASFYVDVPCRQSRCLMLQRWLAGKIADLESVVQELADTTEKFSGADLRSIVKQAISRAEHQNAALSLDLLKSEAARKRMRAIGLYDEFQELRRWGQMYCDPAGPTDN